MTEAETYFMERTGVDCVPSGAEPYDFSRHGDTAECHGEPPTCGCPEIAAHTCHEAIENGLTPAQATDLCPRCQYLLERSNP